MDFDNVSEAIMLVFDTLINDSESVDILEAIDSAGSDDELKDGLRKAICRLDDYNPSVAKIVREKLRRVYLMTNNEQKSTTRVSGGVGFSLLAIVFIVLKLVGVISWSWLWVLAPLWIPIGGVTYSAANFNYSVLYSFFFRRGWKISICETVAERIRRKLTVMLDTAIELCRAAYAIRLRLWVFESKYQIPTCRVQVPDQFQKITPFIFG